MYNNNQEDFWYHKEQKYEELPKSLLVLHQFLIQIVSGDKSRDKNKIYRNNSEEKVWWKL